MPSYTNIEFKDIYGRLTELWRCSECGSAVGPYLSAQKSHDEWHKRIAFLEVNIP